MDTPLREPPLAAMHSSRARTVGRGRFYPVESPGDGTASLYRLPSDRLALRLEDLRTSAYPDLFVWVSAARDPATSAQAAAAPHVELGRLKSTRGDQNYLLPKGLDRDAVASVVVWRAPIGMAYTAAAIE
ncbi:MAG: DM13 domain-containing protein [Actinomycetota bacterium]|nr:DM13 domain-containing protein [Actinomycetota bacterium]